MCIGTDRFSLLDRGTLQFEINALRHQPSCASMVEKGGDMKIISARIRNYRTIQEEVLIELGSGLTLVGPNNAGKTNILKAIRLFFTGFDNSLLYKRENDLSFGQGQQKTSIALTFKIEDSDSEDISSILKQITEILSVTSSPNGEFTIYLTFSSSSNPGYRIFPNSKRPVGGTEKNQYSRLERSFVDLIFNKFAVHYIPSDKSTEQLYSDLVLPFLLRKAYHALTPHLQLIGKAMNDAAESLNLSLSNAGLSNVESTFTFPDDPRRFFKDIDFFLSDPNKTSVFNKGMGIQSAALLAAFNWITSEEVADGKDVLWLLEEPESYLHPELALQCDRLITDLRSASQVVCTTHSLGFVPQNPTQVLGVMRVDGWTKTQSFKTYHEATDRIRRSLGVRFSDFYNLNHFNVLVEGETDREYLSLFCGLLIKHGLSPVFPILTSGLVSFLDQGGVSGLQGFVRATYQFIREEKPCVVMLDGDNAGDKCRRELQSFLGNKGVQFQANRNFIIVRDRFAVEGLFPDEWILQIESQHPNWFENFSTDALGALLPFSVRDENKRQFFNSVRNKAESEIDLEWANRWMILLAALESALRTEALRIHGDQAAVARLLAFAASPEPMKAVNEFEELLQSPILPGDMAVDEARA